MKVGSSSSGSCSSQTRTSTANHTTHTTHVNSSQTAAAANQPHTIGATATAGALPTPHHPVAACSPSPRNYTSAHTQTDELKYFVVNKLQGLEQLFTLAARCLHRYSTPLLVHASEFRHGGGEPAASNAGGSRNCCSVAELLVLSDRCMDAIGQGAGSNPSAAAAAAQREAERAIEHGKAIALAEERAAAGIGGAKPENKNGFLASARSFLFEDDEMPSTAATSGVEIEMSDFTTPKSSNASNKRGGTSPSSSTPQRQGDVGVVGGSTNSSAATFEAAAQRMSRGEAERVRAERMTKTGYILHVDCGHNGALSSGTLKHLALYLEGGSAG